MTRAAVIDEHATVIVDNDDFVNPSIVAASQ